MLDLTSALYLGMTHPSAALAPWSALTLGRPAALQEPPASAAVAGALARLQGCQAGLMLPSTLHLFWDLFGMLAQENFVVLVDGAAYPIARWGAERAGALGLPIVVFAHGALGTLQRLVRHWAALGRRPLILADGYAPGAARCPPLAQYAAIAQAGAGYLVLDDTQALGLFGRAPGRFAPYGLGGGGSLQHHGLGGAHLIVGASLAKAFGVPVALLGGSAALVRRFAANSQTRVHTSPPAVALLHAAGHALQQNALDGDALRWQLWRRVAQWRACMARLGIGCSGGTFPVQILRLGPGQDGVALHAGLAQRGVAAVLLRSGVGATVGFLLRADHSPAQITAAAICLDQVLRARSGASHSHFRRQHGTAIGV